MHTNPEVLALLALGENAAKPAELKHIHTCSQCADEVADMARIAHIGRTTGDDGPLLSPRPEVWERVRAELGFADDMMHEEAAQVIPLPVRHLGGDQRPSPVRRIGGTRWGTGLVAAAMALVVGVGIGLGWQRVTTPRDTVIAETPMTALPRWSGASGSARVEVDKAGNRWLVVSMTTPRPVDGNRQIWLLNAKDASMQAMGFMLGDNARVIVPPQFKLSNFPVVDISLEPASDGDPRHSGESIVRGRLNV